MARSAGGGDAGAARHDRILATAEGRRLLADAAQSANWKRWGPYLSERQWGTVREDYSATGECWTYLSHDDARRRAYRWGEDGLLGITDRECRLCFALALWNGRDPILKERLFGLTGPEGNHGEDAKECWYQLDATPTASYLRGLYKYPQRAFPYQELVEVNRARGRDQREYEITDTAAFADDRYFDVGVEYGKADCDDIAIRITVSNRGAEAASLHLLPTLWFRNTWSWGTPEERCLERPSLRADGDTVRAEQESLGRLRWRPGPGPDGRRPDLLFTENETNLRTTFGAAVAAGPTKDAFHRRVVGGEADAIAADRRGTKCAAWYRLEVPARSAVVIRLRLAPEGSAGSEAEVDAIIDARRAEADAYYAAIMPPAATAAEASICRQAWAGLIWSKQFYHYDVATWSRGDPKQPPPPSGHGARNADWKHLYARDVIAMPDTWEYPWFAAWDLAFHAVAFADIDPDFAKRQLLLLLREWYMHPNGQIPAYEFAFSDVNPPVHAWACWRVYKVSGPRGRRDRLFLERTFQKLLVNFTWWVNRKDPEGHHVFSGGFLGLDNIGVFDRSQPLPGGASLEQADGTAWMAFYCATMLAIALELASEDLAYEDIASKFFEHFVAITDAINRLGGHGLWDEGDGFYYDHLLSEGRSQPLALRSLVGLVPLIAVENLSRAVIDRLPGFRRRFEWFMTHRPELAAHVLRDGADPDQLLLALADRGKLARVLRRALDEAEFLSPHGLRSLSRAYADHPFEFRLGDHGGTVRYTPGESETPLFGGNSNWRGPVWFPINYLLIEALERYHRFLGDDWRIEHPTGSGRMANLREIADDLQTRLAALFVPGADGARPAHGDDRRYADDPHWRDLVLFYEYFDGDTGRGLGASHQTGWTALAARCIARTAARRG